MDFETTFGVCLIMIFVYFSIDFKKHYVTEFHEAARNPFLKFLAGLCVLYIAKLNPMLGGIALCIVFFWIADVQLLSTIVL